MSSDGHILLVPTPPPRPPRPSRWRFVLGILVVVLVLLAAGSTLVVARVGRPLDSSPLVTTASVSDESSEPERLRRRAAVAVTALDKVRPQGRSSSSIPSATDCGSTRTVSCFGSRSARPARVGCCAIPGPAASGCSTRRWASGQIINKRKNPVWAKPDWAFIEEGYLPPPRDSEERFDDVSLGDYGLYMPEGYIIHGTLFKTLLGRRVTHGCVRLGDEDLEFVYKNVPIGSRVYLY